MSVVSNAPQAMSHVARAAVCAPYLAARAASVTGSYLMMKEDKPCERCGKPVEPRGICAKFGYGRPEDHLWLCNACVEIDVDWWEQEEDVIGES